MLEYDCVQKMGIISTQPASGEILLVTPEVCRCSDPVGRGIATISPIKRDFRSKKVGALPAPMPPQDVSHRSDTLDFGAIVAFFGATVSERQIFPA